MKFKPFIISALAGILISACGNNPAPGSSNPETETRADIETRIDALPDTKIAAAMISQMGSLADTLDTVKDEESARKAAKEIAKIGVELEALAKKADGTNSAGKMSIMMQANSNEFMSIQARLATNMARIAMTDPKLLQIIGDEMDKLDLQ